MRALIVGAGAVGRYLAARLVMGGHEAVLLARPAAAREVNGAGIVLRLADGEWPVSVTAAADPADAVLRKPFELVVFAVKSFSTDEAVRDVAAIAATSGATMMSVQNGLGNEERLSAAFGADRVAAAVLTTAVERDGDAVIAAPRGGLSFAPVGSAPHNWLIAALEPTGLRPHAAGDWRALKWSKLCINLLANGVCAALDWTPQQVYADATAFSVERATLVEAVGAMRALGIPPVRLVDFPVPLLVGAIATLPPAVLRAVLSRRVTTARGDKLPSLLLDLRSGRKVTEVGDLNGAVVRAAPPGVSTPANAAVWGIVSRIAAGAADWSRYRGNPAALAAEVR